MARKSLGTSSEVEGVPAPPIGQPEVTRSEIKAEGYFSVYVNDIQMQVTPWDIRLVLAEIQDVTKAPPTINLKALGEIRMSPQLAKKVAIILMGQLRQYEAQFGEIPVPKD
jgi:hypothetical protein